MLARTSSRQNGSGLLALATLALALGCNEDHAQTGVRLTILYGEDTPAWLYVVGRTEDGRFYGPSLLPDPARPLADGRETVLLDLPDAMHGEVLSVTVTGLDAQRAARMRGAVRTEIMRDTIQPAFVSLSMRAPSSWNLDAGLFHPAPDDTSDAGLTGPVDAGDDTAAPSAPVGEPQVGELPDQPPDEIPIEPPVEEPPTDPEQPDAATPPPPPDTGCTGATCPTAMRCDPSEDVCDLKCPGGAHCVIDCGDVKECKPVCKNAICEIDCGGAERCQPTCEGRSVCDITCRGESCDEARCRGDAQCLLRCTGGDDDDERCALECDGEADRGDCEDRAAACNRACP